MRSKILIPICLNLLRAATDLVAKFTSTDALTVLISEIINRGGAPSDAMRIANARSKIQVTERRRETFKIINELANLQTDEEIQVFLRARHLGSVTMPAGDFGRDNERVRLEWVREALAGIPRGARLLDAGAGEQQYKKFCSHLEYVAQDFSQYDGSGDSSGLQTGAWEYGSLDIVSDICDIPEPDESFDAILCTEVFEHILMPVDAVKEFSRLLKPNGTLLLTVPFASLTHFAPYFFYTGFSKFFFLDVLKKNGFSDVSITYNGSYFSYLAQELYRLPSVLERYSRVADPAALESAGWLLQEYLTECAMNDNGSWELLAHGIHVIAKKA